MEVGVLRRVRLGCLSLEPMPLLWGLKCYDLVWVYKETVKIPAI
jgi:hypothetical protein